MCEEIRDASRTDESHQISSWSEQSGGVITLRNGYEGCCSFQEVNWVSNVCFCDAMLQHSEAILCPVHKVTKDRGGGCDKSNLTITVLKKEGCGIRWFHMLSQSGRWKTGLHVKDTDACSLWMHGSLCWADFYNICRRSLFDWHKASRALFLMSPAIKNDRFEGSGGMMGCQLFRRPLPALTAHSSGHSPFDHFIL